MIKIKVEVLDNHIALYDENEEVIGNLDFIKNGNVLVATHTVVNHTMQGRGYAEIMFNKFIEYVDENDYTIRPICSYIVKKMQDPEYQKYLVK